MNPYSLGALRCLVPGEVGAASQVATVKPIIRVEVVAGLVFGGDAGVCGEVDAGAGEQLHVGTVDVPTHPAGELARPAQCEGEVGVVNDGGAIELQQVFGNLGGGSGKINDGGEEVRAKSRGLFGRSCFGVQAHVLKSLPNSRLLRLDVSPYGRRPTLV